MSIDAKSSNCRRGDFDDVCKRSRAPHFHVLFAEYRAAIDIKTLKLDRGALPRGKLRAIIKWAKPRRAKLLEAWSITQAATPRENSMKKLPRITSAEPVIHGVLKLIFSDGYEGVVDLRPLIAQGRIFAWLQKPKNFQRVQLQEFGHHIFWTNGKGEEIDLGADSLRRDAEKQAELHRVIAS